MRLAQTTRTIHMTRRAEDCEQVTWQPKGCGLASTPNETDLHRAYFASFRDIHMRIYHLKIAGKRDEAAKMAAEYNSRSGGVIPCMCGCGQKPVF